MYKDYRPFRFFCVLALLCLLVAVAFFIPVFREYLFTGMVRRFPTLIVCGFAGLFAGISFFSGIILQTILRSKRQDFEIALHEIHYRKMELAGKADTR